MALSTFMQKGLSTLLKVVNLSNQQQINQATAILKTHLTLTTEEIAQAYQNSYELALHTIIAGLGKPLLSDSRTSMEFASQIVPNYLQPFVAQQDLQNFARQYQFCTNAMTKCQILIQHKASLFQGEPIPLTETDLMTVITDNEPLFMTELIIEQLRRLEATRSQLNEKLVTFLSFNELLGTAMVFFLDEELRQHEAFRDTINALQKNGLWLDIRELKNTAQQLMTHFNLCEQIKVVDEFVQHNNDSLKQIQTVVCQLKQLAPNHPQYTQLMTMGGSLLFSNSTLPEAENCFVQAQKMTSNEATQALLAFNLFQIRLQLGQAKQALADLQQAIAIDPNRYALHNIHRYPILWILGAGGMGCVFLCQDKLHKKLVVVKSFWEPHHEAIKDIFQEVFAMSDIVGDFVPMPLDYGYVDPIKQERAFFVIEHIDGAMDGERWLNQKGKLNVKEGLQVGLKIAKGLQKAHTAGILHLDLKPANILLKREKNTIHVKMIDFGLSQMSQPTQQPKDSSLNLQEQPPAFGTAEYAAPERHGIEHYGKPSEKSDVFAFGATLYRLLTHESPRQLNPRRLLNAPELFELLCDCVEPEPTKRPTLKTIIKVLNKFTQKLQSAKPRLIQWSEQLIQKWTVQQTQLNQQMQTQAQQQREQAKQALAAAQLINIKNDETFENEVIKADSPVLVYYWAEWIKACFIMNTFMKKIAQEYEGLVKMVTLNIDDNPMIPSQYELKEIPTFMIFKNGSVAAVKMGSLSQSQLTQFINKHL
jgi:thioredoxin